MKRITVVALSALVSAASACAIHVSTSSSPRPAAPPPPPRAPAPAPLPHAPAPLAVPVAPPVAAVPPPALVGTPAGRLHLTHLAPATIHVVDDAVNVQALHAARAKLTKNCGPNEVAPGVWVRVDCHAYKPIPRAIRHMSAKKHQVIQAQVLRFHRVHLGAAPPAPVGSKPGTFGAAPPPTAGADSGGDAAQVFPDTVDHREGGHEGPVKNQGYVGSCTAFSLSTVMDNALRRAGKTDVVSPLHLWAHYGTPAMDAAGDANVNRTITTYQSWPYSAREACQMSTESEDDCGSVYGVSPNTASGDAKIRGELARAESSGVAKFVSLEALQVQPADPSEIISVLASGSDLWAAFRIDGSHWSSGAMKNAVIPDWTDWDGGHAVVVAGYRKTPSGGRQYLIHNSWGEQWGDKGYAWISEAMVIRFMSYAYKMKLDGGQAPPKEDLTDDDCAEDALVDAVTGQCAAMCDDGSRRSNGACP